MFTFTQVLKSNLDSLSGWLARPSVMGPTMVQTTGRLLCPPQLLLFWSDRFGFGQTEASRLGQGGLLLPEERKGKERAVFGWSRGWVGDLGAVPAAAEPDQSQPSPLVPGPPMAAAATQAF